MVSKSRGLDEHYVEGALSIGVCGCKDGSHEELCW